MSRLRQVFHPPLQSTNNTGYHTFTVELLNYQICLNHDLSRPLIFTVQEPTNNVLYVPYHKIMSPWLTSVFLQITSSSDSASDLLLQSALQILIL